MAGPEAGDPDADDLLAQLARWSAADRTARAVFERAHTRSLVDQAAGAATWTGTLVDLAEAQSQVVCSLIGGAKLTGRIVGVGRDFAVVERSGAGPVLVRSDAVTAIAPVAGSPVGVAAGPGSARPGSGPGSAGPGSAGPGSAGPGSAGPGSARPASAGPASAGRPGGDRRPASELTLAAALDALAGEAVPVLVRTPTESFAGRVSACGTDVVTLMLEGVGRRVVHLPVRAVAAVELR